MVFVTFLQTNTNPVDFQENSVVYIHAHDAHAADCIF